MSGFELMHGSAIGIFDDVSPVFVGNEVKWGGERKVGVEKATYRRTAVQLIYITDLHPECTNSSASGFTPRGISKSNKTRHGKEGHSRPGKHTS
jgi:hypothetical protein